MQNMVFTSEQIKKNPYLLYDFKLKDIILISCDFCGNNKQISVKEIKNKLIWKGYKGVFCSPECHNKSQITEVQKPCGNCSKSVSRDQREFKKSKSGNLFCSRSCAAIYNNQNKTYGTRRSKMEIFLETEILKKFSHFNPVFNKLLDGKELDIYFTDIKVACEINGIHHYKPIYGDEKLKNRQKNDKKKKEICKKKDIKLLIINISKLQHFNEIAGLKCFEKICDVIAGKYTHKKIINFMVK